jgi:hypothetical protein
MGMSFHWLDEGSLDPNDLREALPAAFRAAGGTLLEETELLSVKSVTGGVVRADDEADGVGGNVCELLRSVVG